MPSIWVVLGVIMAIGFVIRLMWYMYRYSTDLEFKNTYDPQSTGIVFLLFMMLSVFWFVPISLN